MANPERGEVELKAGDKTYILRLSLNELCVLEERFDKSISEIAGTLNDPATFRIGTFRAVVWAGLAGNEPRPSEAEAGDIIAAATLPVTMEAVQKAFALTMPAAAADAGEAAEGNV